MLRRFADVGVFVLVAIGLAWLVALPLWFGNGLASPFLVVVAGIMMFTPTLGVLAVWLSSRTGGRIWARRTGLGLGERKGRTVLIMFAAWFGTPLISVLAIALSAALGLFSLDLGGLSLFRQQLAGVDLPMDAQTLLIVQIAGMVLIAPLINAPLAFGEEWGWRGWLLPRLTTLGVLPGLLISGLIWGIWHAPLTLLGYNYPQLGAGAAPVFIAFCTIYGVLIGWLRLYSGSVWPAVLAHGSFNASAGLAFLLGDASAPPNPLLAGATGVVGWVAIAALAALLVRFLPVRVTGDRQDAPGPLPDAAQSP